MQDQTIAEMIQSLDNKEYSCVELCQHYLDRIASIDPGLNAYISTMPETALEQARQMDALRSKSAAPALAGIPIAHKDIVCTKGHKTSAGSKMLDNFIAPYSATLAEKLESAGTVLLGKTNMDEFAMGSSNENSYYGPVKNPWNTGTIPGGSSGGSAAAVAAQLCAGATGTDTGGSIRQPAAMCGITGIKPTYGRVSRWGVIAYASSLDQAGPMARSAEDAAILLSAMSGFDSKDSTSIEAAVPDYQSSLNAPLTGLRVGICREYFEAGLDAGVEQTIRGAFAM